MDALLQRTKIQAVCSDHDHLAVQDQLRLLESAEGRQQLGIPFSEMAESIGSMSSGSGSFKPLIPRCLYVVD